MKKFLILVCLYKKSIATSNTIQSLIASKELIASEIIYIWDNSPLKMDSNELTILRQYFPYLIYNNTPENTVLSKIYNSIIEEFLNKTSYFIFLDDDSDINKKYFLELNKKTFEYPQNLLFLPSIYSNNKLISPAKDYIFFSKLLKSQKSGYTSSKHLTAINSGMIISNKIFNSGFRYDDRLNFYGTDNYFMYYYRHNNNKLYILDTKINHQLSFYNNINIDSKINIYKEIKRANLIIYEKNIFKKYLSICNNFIVSILNCFRYKSIKFLKND
jgi:hypothetical protein